MGPVLRPESAPPRNSDVTAIRQQHAAGSLRAHSRGVHMRIIIIAAGLAAMAVPAFAQLPAPAEIVKAWDKDGDGAVSKEEWTAAGRPAERFDAVDADKN